MSLGNSVAMAVQRVVAPIEGIHMAISRPWLAAAGTSGRTVGWIHDAVLSGAYGSVRLGAAALGVAIDHRVRTDAPVSLKGQAIVNGLWGDDLGPFSDGLEISMEITDSAGDVVTDMSGLDRVPAEATPHLVVLVHGLFESQDCWRGSDSTPGLIELLETRPHLTVLSVRYNSGREISDNAEQFASMLNATCAAWPVPVESIVLVGNSMGGLLIHSTCAVAEREGWAWLARVSDVVAVATPYRGTPIEKGVNAISSALSIADSTRPLASFLDSRSAGIKDLRHGMIDVNAAKMPPNVNHHCVAAVVTSDPTSLVGFVVGDLVVRPTSASTGGHVSPSSVTVIGGTNHFAALTNSAVIDLVVECVDPVSART
jgi:pimeloyl-ACP methyl ester carboxylesterase